MYSRQEGSNEQKLKAIAGALRAVVATDDGQLATNELVCEFLLGGYDP